MVRGKIETVQTTPTPPSLGGEIITLSLVFDEMPIKRKKCSHTGNTVFPPWEHDIPTLGIYCRDAIDGK